MTVKDTTYEDAELLDRIISVVTRLHHGDRLRLMGLAKGLALAGTAGPTCHDAARAGTLEEVFGICDAYLIGTYPAAELLLELFQERGALTHADIHAFKLSRAWDDPAPTA